MVERRYTALGLISGTSMDGIDAAIIETDGARVFACHGALTHPYPAEVRTRLLAVARDPVEAETPLADLEAAVTGANVAAVAEVLSASAMKLSQIDIIGLHGQTILHRPERRYTRQLGDGAALARMTGCDVVSGFRLADVAAGGQGAPFAPLYHVALAADLPRPLAVLNLGGVGNVTYLGDSLVTAFDTGPASAMIDDWVGRHLGLAYDAGGAVAAGGTVDQAALARLMDNEYFRAAPPKSLDRNDFPLTPVEGLSVADGAATLTRFTARSVAASLPHLPGAPKRWLVTGGGRHNATMMAMLAEELGVPVDPVESVGWRGDSLEAECFGFLAVRSLLGLPLSLPTTTGVPHPLTGGILHRRPEAA